MRFSSALLAPLLCVFSLLTTQTAVAQNTEASTPLNGPVIHRHR